MNAGAPLSVLMFHGVRKEIPDYAVFPGGRTCLIRESDFESCISWCARTHRIVSLADIPRYLRGDATEPGILITFDDGLASVTDLAVPILQRHHATAVLFVTTGWVDSGETPAIFRLERDLWETPPRRVDVRANGHEFSAAVETKAGARRAVAALWSWCFEQQIAPVSLRTESVRLDGRAWAPDPSRQDRGFWFPATWEAITSAAASGTLEIAAHGVTHTPWPWLSARERHAEIGGARERLESIVHRPVRACSYPHGRFDAETIATVREQYDWGFTTIGRPVHGATPYELPRFHVPGERPVIMDAILRWPLVARALRVGASVLNLD